MQDKIYVLLAYALVGIAIAISPILARVGSTSILRVPSSKARVSVWQMLVLALGGISLILARGSLGLSVAFAIGIISALTSLASGRLSTTSVFAAFVAIYAATSLPWWRQQNGLPEISALHLVWLGIATLACAAAFASASGSVRTSYAGWLLPYAAVALVLSFSTGILSDDGALLTLWHHWGAYIGPSELLLSGATVFRDFPLQYGLGPTALIAGFCGDDCWRGMYVLAGSATFLFSTLIALMALALCENRWPQRLVAMVTCLAACFFWTAYPPEVSSPLMTPSVSGLRFLPAVVLAAYLFFSDSIETSRVRVWVAHSLWAAGALWSPESAFYVTFIWWPYYLLLRVLNRANSGSVVKELVGASGALLGLALGVILVFVLGFRLLHGSNPSFYGYLAYAIHPPGPMPINRQGAVLFFLLATVLGLCALWRLARREGDIRLLRRGFVVQLLSYAAASYFLGRSHDNNLLNILPFVVLVLLHAIRTLEGEAVRVAAIALVAALIGWLPLFGWKSWIANVKDGKVLSFDAGSLVNPLSLSDPETSSKVASRFRDGGLDAGLPADAGRAITYIGQTYGEPVTVLDYSLNLVRSPPSVAWSAIHGPANFAYIPSQQRRRFLGRTAESLKRPGWLVIDRKFPADEWLADFETAYRRSVQLEFGTYYAVRLVPKSTP